MGLRLVRQGVQQVEVRDGAGFIAQPGCADGQVGLFYGDF